MTFIILSLISLLSATCYGAVDLEALKIKAAEYAKNATPILLADYKEDSEENELKETTKVLLLHTTPEDKASGYHYHLNVIEKGHQGEYRMIRCMSQVAKEELRKILVQNKWTCTNTEIVKELGIVLCDADSLSNTEKSYWSKFKNLIGIGNQEPTFINPWERISPLNLALMTGQYDIAIHLILQNKESLNIIADNGITALFCAIDKPNCQFMPELLRFMIEQGANPQLGQKLRDGAMHSILHVAADLRQFKAMQILEEEYNIQDPLLAPAQKAEWNEKPINVGIMLIKKNDSTITPFKTIEEFCAVFERVLAFKAHLEEGETLCVLPTKKIALHQDSPLLQAVNDKDKKLVAYMLNRWGEHINPIDMCFAAIRALHTGQSDIVTLFKAHGVVLNDTLSGNTIRCDLDENDRGPFYFKLETPPQEEKQEVQS